MRPSGKWTQAMAHMFNLTATMGLLLSLGVHAQETDRYATRQPNEVCEAFSWDVPAEHSFTVESILRWRNAMQSQSEKRAAQARQARTTAAQVREDPLLR